MAARKKPVTEKSAPAKKYQRTEADKQLINRQVQKRDAAQKGSVRFADGVMSFDHEDNYVGQAQLMEALGTSDTRFLDAMLRDVANIAEFGIVKGESGMNFVLSLVKSIKPRDHVEVLLGLQMATVHMHSMRTARLLGRSDTLEQTECMEKALNKLTRSFTNQMEALRKYRTGGEQKVTVQHVHVNEGGQAVVGEVHHKPSIKSGGQQA